MLISYSTQVGFGDNVCALPAMKYIKDAYPWVTPYLYAPDYFVPLVKNMMPDLICRPFSKGTKFFNGTWPGRQTLLKGHDSLSTHLVDYNFHALANKQVEDRFKNYLKLDLDRISTEKFKLPENYMVIATGYTAPIRKFPGHTVNAIADFLNSQGITPVYLGGRQAGTGGASSDIISQFGTDVDYTKGLDLIDKTSLIEAGKIIGLSKGIIAVDCGLMHIAGCTEVPIIGGFTSVDPFVRAPYRNSELGWNCYNVVPPDDNEEKFFQSRLDFVYDKDFKFSWKNNDDLVNSLTAEMFIEQIKKIL